MIHLTTHQLSSHLDGELPESSIQLVRRHLESCEACPRRFAALREQEAVLERVLAHDPGEEFFARFAEQVLGEPERPALERRRVAVEPSGADATATPGPRLDRQPAIPWFTAAILCLIVGAIGYTLPRPIEHASKIERTSEIEHPPTIETTPEIEQAPEVESTPARAPDTERAREPLAVSGTQSPPPEENIAPDRRILTTTEVRNTPALSSAPAARVAPPPAAPPDEFAAAPAAAIPLIAAARQASSAAARDSSAANLDAVGDAWEQVVPTLNGTEQTIARQDLAEARFGAWVVAPDPYRAAAATASLRSFVVLSPPGPRRDLAKEWLRRINGG